MDNLQSRLRLLRLFLFCGCAGWAISVLGVFLPWNLALAGLTNMGAERLPAQPMLDYCLCVGLGILLAGHGLTETRRPPRDRGATTRTDE